MSLNGQNVTETPLAKVSRSKITQPDFDFTKPLVWSTPEVAGEQFAALVAHPPIHSVVVTLYPEAAKFILGVANERNRPVTRANVEHIAKEIEEGNFAVTGDTIKFDKKGFQLDGQHRLLAVEKVGKPVTMHLVFGLDEDVFDILDMGRKRTPGDILAIRHVPDPKIVAAAARWVHIYDTNGWGGKQRMSNRNIRHLVETKYPGIADYIPHGLLISKAYKYSPSLITAVLYLIARKDKKLATDFVQEWVHGARIDRNENFDILSARLMKVAAASGGYIDMRMRFAFLVQIFNHWNAGVVAAPRSLSWSKSRPFPQFEFDPQRFRGRQEDAERLDGSRVTEAHMRVLEAMTDFMISKDTARASWSELSEKAQVSAPTVGNALKTLEEAGLIERMTSGQAGGHKSEYRILPGDK